VHCDAHLATTTVLYCVNPAPQITTLPTSSHDRRRLFTGIIGHWVQYLGLQWRYGRRVGGQVGNCPTPLNFSLLENFLLVGKFSSKNTKFGAKKIPILGVCMDKIEILTTYNVLCRKFTAVCRKLQFSAPPNFFNRRGRCWYSFHHGDWNLVRLGPSFLWSFSWFCKFSAPNSYSYFFNLPITRLYVL